MVEHKCPICGGQVDVSELTYYPGATGATSYRCRNRDCSYSHQVEHKIEAVTAPWKTPSRDELAHIMEVSFHDIVTESEDWRPVADYVLALIERATK